MSGELRRTGLLDPEHQASLARHGLSALDQLLNSQPPGDRITCEGVGALVRLIAQAASVGAIQDREAA